MKYRFYYAAENLPQPNSQLELDAPYKYLVWRPTILSVVPRGVAGYGCILSFLYVWVTYLFSWKRQRYFFLLIYRGTRVVHYTGVLRACFRFPFMTENELQLGPAWTHPAYRRRGLLAFALQTLMNEYARNGHALWWLCREANAASIQAIEKAGFSLEGTGTKTCRLGLRFLGVFRFSGTGRRHAADSSGPATP